VAVGRLDVIEQAPEHFDRVLDARARDALAGHEFSPGTAFAHEGGVGR
jgi:hypothetical protein